MCCESIHWEYNRHGAKFGDGEIRPTRKEEIDPFLTGGEQSTLKSELSKLMRVARIARPDATADARTSETNA